MRIGCPRKEREDHARQAGHRRRRPAAQQALAQVEFEEKFAACFGAKYAVACPSGVSALHPALEYASGSWPEAERAGREAFVLQVHPSVEEADLRQAAEAVAKVATSPARRQDAPALPSGWPAGRPG
jgi:hypothetical protein